MPKEKKESRLLRFLWKLIPWVFVALLAMVVVSIGGRIQEKSAQQKKAKAEATKEVRPATRVISLRTRPRLLKDAINLPAEIQPMEDLMVRAEVGGRVINCPVDEGQEVKPGQVICTMDDRDYRTALSRVQANYQLAKAEYSRISTLAQKKVTAKSQLDSIEAQLKDLEAQMAAARLALTKTAITAPIKGRLNRQMAKDGDFLGVGDPVAQILQTNQVKVKVGVPESDVAAVFDLKSADVIIEALDGLRVKGRKTYLSHQPSSLARLYDLELKLDNPDGRILPGMFVRVELVKKTIPGALVVPLYAVISENSQQFIYVEKEGKAYKRPVELGILEGWQVQVVRGLQPDENVIVVGHRLLEDGQKVDVLKTVNDPREIVES